MSDKSFGDYVNRNIVKNPLLSTAVTGLSLEDLTHNAVLVPVAPNQGLITGSDQTGPYTQTLANADHEITNLPSGDSNSNFLPTQPSISTQSFAQDSLIREHHDQKPELPIATVSKASAKSEDDFDVNEYFARLQGTRYVSAPLHTHQDPNANLTDAEENLEEINLNDDKNVEIQHSLTADIAQNFSQLPTVLPQVASAVFSSFSNMWSMKSREQTPDDRSQGSQSYQDVHYNRSQTSNQFSSRQGSSYQDVQFQANQNLGLGQFQGGPGLGAAVQNVPLMNTENVVREVAPPPKEPPVCGTSNFRLTTKKKYAQIPGLTTKETQQIAFNPVTTNVPSYFIPKDNNPVDLGPTVEAVKQETKDNRLPSDHKEEYNIFNPIDDSKATASDCQPISFMPIEQPKLIDETQSINLQNQSTIIPPPPMFSATKRDSQSAKSVLPPSVARRIGSNHPLIKQHVVQQTVTENIFVPIFDPAVHTESVTDVTQQSSVPMFAPVVSQQEKPIQTQSTVIGPASQVHTSKSGFLTQPNPEPAMHAIFHPGQSEPVGFSNSNSSFTSEPTLPPTSNFFAPPPTVSQVPANLGQVQPNIGPTLFTPPASFTKNVTSQADLPAIPQQVNPTQIPAFGQQVTNTIPPTGIVQEQPEPPKPPMEPPKAVGASNFRMTKKRPQYYSGPIEGIGSISNSIKPTLPVVDSGTFQGALFTPEQQADVNAPSFDLNKQTQANASYTPFDITNQATNIPTVPIPSPSAYPNYHVTQPTQNYEPYPTAFDLSRPTENYDYKDEPKETKGFGIIGSLKSKLSNLDINKIQNSVTTFFDPGYNDTKKDSTAIQENAPYHPQYDAHTQSKIEIFVPQVEQSQPYYNYRSDQSAHDQPDQAYSNKYDYQNQSLQFTDVPTPYQYYQGNYSVPLHGTTHGQISNVYTNIPPQRSYDAQEHIDNTPKSYDAKEIKHDTEIIAQVPQDTAPFTPTVIEPAETNEEETAFTRPTTHLFETQNPLFDEYKTQTPMPIASEIRSYITPQVKPEENPTLGPFSNIGLDNLTRDGKITDVSEQSNVKDKVETPKGDNLLESLNKGEVPILGVASVPLFGLSTIIADKSRDVETSEMSLPFIDKTQSKDLDRVPTMSLFENIGSLPQKTLDANDGQDASASFSFFEKDNVPKVSFFANDGNHCDLAANVDVTLDRKNSLFEGIGGAKEELSLKEETVLENKETDLQDDTENVSELNICETCREFNKPEDKELEIEDLTTYLIENITSPIQLSNAVEVPLTEDNNTERVEFDADQFEEISHITEETIETIHVQSATELLDDEDVKIMNYGWATNEAGSLKHHDFSFKGEPSSLGFFGDSLFSDNVPANASDELKAEYKHQEDLAPSQMSVPSAPPVEDNSKTEETGVLDVHSIELDAKEDFPIYEEYVNEPSETDDDKIEFKEREKTEGNDFDSFTNRVEKYKKMEEVTDNEESKMMPKYLDLSNQPISMASYFDTGNYAADTHYRNTMSSPTQVSIPPGFEEEFKKRLALVKALNAKKVPDTQTQTKTTMSLSFSTSHSTYCQATTTYTTRCATPVGFNIEANVSKIVEDKSENLSQSSDTIAPRSIEVPNSSSIFCAAVEDTITPPNMSSTVMAKPQNIIGSGVKMAETANLFGVVKSNTPGPSALSSTVPSGSSIEKSEPDTKLPDPLNFFSKSPTPEPVENFNRLASYFNSPPKTEHAKSFFELSQSQNHYRHATIPEKYRDLINDLTSIQNLEIPTIQNIRQVNYFTVEKDVATSLIQLDHFIDKTELEDEDVNSLKNCKHCIKLLNKSFKVKTAMNDENGKGKTGADTSSILSTPDQHTRDSITVNFDDLAIEDANQNVGSAAENTSSTEYIPVKHHWFYRVDIDDKSIWRGFSVTDSLALETAHLSPELNESTVVPTDGGRYDVNVVGRLRIPVYWDDKPTNVRRCSWFYKGTTDPRFVPYTEPVADKLEMEYLHGITTGEWHRRLPLPNGEVVVMHGPTVMVHFLSNDTFTTPPQSASRPRVVRRGHDESEIEDPEPSSIDHLLLLCHGVGSACDMRFRSVEEVVEDFRATSLQLLQSHYKNSFDQGIVNRVEVLPISWHATLHSGETGVDRRLQFITLDSIPRLRNFTNDTVLDVLFYTSPVFCQTILNTVCDEMNRIYELFKLRNPNFKGGVSLGGHSLGSVILYDLLCNQKLPEAELHSQAAHQKAYVPFSSCSVETHIKYPKLLFKPDALYALGSPIAIFECIRGVESLGANFALPTCKHFFNIFHPYDPIAYRIEPLINPSLRNLKPYLIPHHKGRKRMHLELKDTMVRVGSDLKQKLLESLKYTWNKWKTQTPEGPLESVMESEMETETLVEEEKEKECKENETWTPEMLGHLNAGRRVDYVLQEAPLEMINEYLFAMSSHVGYWESEDTMLLMLREIYSALGIEPDSTVPQQNMTVERTRKTDRTVTYKDNPSTSKK